MEIDKTQIVNKPIWGHEEIIINNKNYCCKKLFLKMGCSFSLRYHKKKHKTLYVDKGAIRLEIGESGDLDKGSIVELFLRPGDVIDIPPLTLHRAISITNESIIIETSTYDSDDDTYKIKERTVAVSGYFDPLHIGHIEYIRLAKKLGDRLVVILNNDEQAIKKKGYSFMPESERAAILLQLRDVNSVMISIDKDATVCKSLEVLKPDVFAKGGDRYSFEIPEAKVCRKMKVTIVDGLGEKIQSSSELVANYENNKRK